MLVSIYLLLLSILSPLNIHPILTPTLDLNIPLVYMKEQEVEAYQFEKFCSLPAFKKSMTTLFNYIINVSPYRMKNLLNLFFKGHTGEHFKHNLFFPVCFSNHYL